MSAMLCLSLPCSVSRHPDPFLSKRTICEQKWYSVKSLHLWNNITHTLYLFGLKRQQSKGSQLDPGPPVAQPLCVPTQHGGTGQSTIIMQMACTPGPILVSRYFVAVGVHSAWVHMAGGRGMWRVWTGSFECPSLMQLGWQVVLWCHGPCLWASW